MKGSKVSTGDGVALIAPLCKFAEDMIPDWLVKQILIGVAKVLPKSKLVPQKEEVKENIFRDVKNIKLKKGRCRRITLTQALKDGAENMERQGATGRSRPLFSVVNNRGL